MLLSKIHRAHVTFRDLNYVGSITIDKKILDATGMIANERVEVYNIDNGQRFATYIIEGKYGSGVIGVNGAAARLVSIGDKVIIVNFGNLNPEEIAVNKPKIIVIEDDDNLLFSEVK
jgi:aspartate 1-decarboxylase